MQELRCKKCGLALGQRGDKYVCPGCGAEYQAEDARRVADEMARLLDEQKQERVANLRQQLWVEFNKEHYNRVEISRLAKAIKAYLPDDFFANFCDLATGEDARRLNEFLYAVNVEEHSIYIWDMLSFLLHPLRGKNLQAVNVLLERAGDANLDRKQYNRFHSLLVDEAQKLDAGIYDATIPRDVFVAYSHEDIAQVGELVEALEAQKISCFVAARNLQHGAIQNYEEQLRSAMDSCRTVVFVSSKNSRSRDCDALKELSYIQKCDFEAAPQYRGNYAKMPKEVKRPRVEYLIDKYTGTAADAIVKEFFAGFEYCKDKDIVAKRILELLAATPAANVKYCRSCGAENAKKAKFCSECGSREFVDTYAEYEEIKRKKAEEARREAEAVRRAEEENKKAEEARKRAEEEKRQAEEERKRAEEERREAEEARRRAEEESGKTREDYKQQLAQEAASRCRKKWSTIHLISLALLLLVGIPYIVLFAVTLSNDVWTLSLWSPMAIAMVVLAAVLFIGVIMLAVTYIRITVLEVRSGSKKRLLLTLTCLEMPALLIPVIFFCIGACGIEYSSYWAILFGILGAFVWFYELYMSNYFDFSERIGVLGVILIFGSVVGIAAYTFVLGLPTTIRSDTAYYGNYSQGIYYREEDYQIEIVDCDERSTEIVIPAEINGFPVTSIGNRAFEESKMLESIVIPNSVTNIGNFAFSGCTGLRNITIPNNITRIGWSAFEDCTGLTSFTIPNSVTSIEHRAFYGCTGLTSITIPDTQWWSVFSECTSLTSVTIMEGATEIAEGAFRDSTTLTSITIPNSVTSIGEYAFEGCTGLTSITIPNSVKSIGKRAFACCGNAQIYCHAKEPEEWPAGWDESLKDRIIWDE